MIQPFRAALRISGQRCAQFNSCSAGCAIASSSRQAQSLSDRNGASQIADYEGRLLPTFLIIGRPNVGKSTLFNRLTGKRVALVYDTPGSHVTRDYKEGTGRLSDLSFNIVDTSGLEPSMASGSIQGRATALTQQV